MLSHFKYSLELMEDEMPRMRAREIFAGAEKWEKPVYKPIRLSGSSWGVQATIGDDNQAHTIQDAQNPLTEDAAKALALQLNIAYAWGEHCGANNPYC